MRLRWTWDFRMGERGTSMSIWNCTTSGRTETTWKATSKPTQNKKPFLIDILLNNLWVGPYRKQGIFMIATVFSQYNF